MKFKTRRPRIDLLSVVPKPNQALAVGLEWTANKNPSQCWHARAGNSHTCSELRVLVHRQCKAHCWVPRYSQCKMTAPMRWISSRGTWSHDLRSADHFRFIWKSWSWSDCTCGDAESVTSTVSGALAAVIVCAEDYNDKRHVRVRFACFQRLWWIASNPVTSSKPFSWWEQTWDVYGGNLMSTLSQDIVWRLVLVGFHSYDRRNERSVTTNLDSTCW